MFDPTDPLTPLGMEDGDKDGMDNGVEAGAQAPPHDRQSALLD